MLIHQTLERLHGPPPRLCFEMGPRYLRIVEDDA
jgi:hypothetical protein